MLSKELELSLNNAFKEARARRFEFMTVEHLLLAMIDNPTAAQVLRSCGGNLDQLRDDLDSFIDENTPLLDESAIEETQPTLGFQRVLQRSVFHVQSSGGKSVTGANILVAIFGEQDSQSVHLLIKQNVTRLDVVNYISHGITRQDNNAPRSQEHDDLNLAKIGRTLELKRLPDKFFAGRTSLEPCVRGFQSAVDLYVSSPEQRQHIVLCGPYGSGKRVLVRRILSEMNCPLVELDAQNILSCGKNILRWMSHTVNKEMQSYGKLKLGVVYVNRFETLLGGSPRCEEAMATIMTLLSADHVFLNESDEVRSSPLVVLSRGHDITENASLKIPDAVRALAPHTLKLNDISKDHLQWLMNDGEPLLQRYQSLMHEQNIDIDFHSNVETALTTWAAEQKSGLAGIVRALDELLIHISMGRVSGEIIDANQLMPILKDLESDM